LRNIRRHLRLPDTEITEYLLGTTKDRIKFLRPLELLDKFPHSRPGKSTTTEDLDGVICDLACEAGRLHLEEGYLTSGGLQLYATLTTR